MQVYLVRHPRPLVAPGVCYGASDVVCSAEVLESAADYLTAALPKGLRLLSSPLSRCEQLAQILCGREAGFAYKTDDRLAEMNFGAWEMQAWAAIAPDELSAWTDSFASYRCGGTGQSTGIFVQRVAQRLLESARSGQDQIWITHAGVIRAVQWLSQQPFETVIAMADSQAVPFELLASDWPRSELAYCQVLRWGEPTHWPKHWPAVLQSAV